MLTLTKIYTKSVRFPLHLQF